MENQLTDALPTEPGTYDVDYGDCFGIPTSKRVTLTRAAFSGLLQDEGGYEPHTYKNSTWRQVEEPAGDPLANPVLRPLGSEVAAEEQPEPYVGTTTVFAVVETVDGDYHTVPAGKIEERLNELGARGFQTDMVLDDSGLLILSKDGPFNYGK